VLGCDAFDKQGLNNTILLYYCLKACPETKIQEVQVCRVYNRRLFCVKSVCVHNVIIQFRNESNHPAQICLSNFDPKKKQRQGHSVIECL